jgi:hypothetical protein
MSCKVLVIPEDPTYNGYLLKPLVERLLDEAGKPKAQVLILRDPKTGGFEHACDLIASGELRGRYGYYDLWVFLPDGDQLKDLANLEACVQNQKAPLIACYVIPEVEVTVIAGHPVANTADWAELRSHPNFKEQIFKPFLDAHGNPRAPGQGREKLMLEALKNYNRMKQLVPELADVEARIAETLGD